MNDLIKLKKKIEIRKWLDDRGVENYTINEDLTVDAEDVYLDSDNITHIPFQFNIADTFSIRNNKLTSTLCLPKKFDYLYIHNNNLTNLLYLKNQDIQYVGMSGNPCAYIYETLGLTTQAHFEALKELEPNPKETLAELKKLYPNRYREIKKYIKETQSFLDKLK